MDPPTTAATTSPRPASPQASLDSERPASFVRAHRDRIFMALAIAGTLFLMPFSVNNFLQGRIALGIGITIVVLCLAANGAAIFFKRPPPVPAAMIFAPSLAGLGLAMYFQGLAGILWSYAAILLFHFVLPRRTANWFNTSIVLVAVPLAYVHLGGEMAMRVATTLALTILFTNIFSFIAAGEQRKQAEQRQRLDMLVRGTHAGTVELDVPRGITSYSPRLREMLGYAQDLDMSRQNFFSLVHPQDREAARTLFLQQLRQIAPEGSMRHQVAHEFRLLHSGGHKVWVHAEGMGVAGKGGRVVRYISSFMDITERVRAEEELRRSHTQVEEQARLLEQQNTALREAIRVREEVERIARHDLRTPLGSIASVPRLLREGRTLSPREDELLGMVERAALRVLSMVNLSLDLYRMEEGSYRLRAQPVDLAAVAQTVLRDIRAHAASKGVALVFDAPPSPVFAHAEELLCYSIVANLLKNALEASPDGATVAVSLREDAAEAWLAIHNEGAIPAPIRASFFDKYATWGKAGGTGLGAFSARLMARVQQGELLMRSSEEEGTTLALRLPLGQAPAPRDSGLMPLDAAPHSTPELPALDVLLVDDDEYNVLVLRSMLPSPPLRVRVAVNGRAAVDAVARQRPDVVFLDLEMPIMGGMEALGAIRALQRASAHPPSTIIAFSAHDDEATRARCLAAGFDLYLAKPASRQELMAVLQTEGAHPGI